jgi:hypothetical protein
MLDNILLESEQLNLLSTLVEADHSLPREERQEFFVLEPGFGSTKHEILHKGLINGRIEVLWMDIIVLANQNLILMSNQYKVPTFGISPLGFKFYEHINHETTKTFQESPIPFQNDLHDESQITLYDHEWVKLRQQMTDYFNKSELKVICFDLGIDSENLRWETKDELVIQIIEQQKRKKQIPELLHICQSKRPEVFGWIQK